MKLSKLLATRKSLIRHANLANLAYAYQTIKGLSDRIAAAQLRGAVQLRQADADAEQYWASLTALEGSQSVIEEHFNEEDITDLADAVVYAIEGNYDVLEFRLEEVGDSFVDPLRRALTQAGIADDLGQADHAKAA